jgi:exopolyphosphatase/guanosine-5'-triphosphate,3'-diphosphate pyrophosphatase
MTYNLSLGRDTFDKGKISFEKIDKVCDVIKNFRRAAEGYGVRNVVVTATTAVREAKNREYLLDQIKIKTGTTVKVYDDMEEKLHIYRMMKHVLGGEYDDSALMVYNGSGNLGVSLLEEGRIPYVRNIRIGSLRISENFVEVQEYSSEFQLVIDEYFSTFLDIIIDEIPENIRHFIASGHEMPLIAELCGCPSAGVVNRISRTQFEKFHDRLKDKSVGRISEECGITSEEADVMLPAVIVYHKLMSLTECEDIIFPAVYLSDSLLFEELYPREAAALTNGYNKNVLFSARMLAKKFRVQEEHCRAVEKFACAIFDEMKKIHGLGPREKVLLQTAAILHDIGKHVNVTDHHLHSFCIVRGSDIVGLSDLENQIVANLCCYHSTITPNISDEHYAQFRPRERVLVSKLAAILRIAEGLDRSHLQKFSRIDVKAGENGLSVVALTNANADLEQWAFRDKAIFFEEVFGIKAIFMRKGI